MRVKLFFLTVLMAALLFACGKKDTSEESGKAAEAKAVAYKEAPMLKARVDAGELPPLEQRLPKEPMVIEPFKEIGKYGGTMEMSGNVGWSFDADMPSRELLYFWTPDSKNVVPNIARAWEISEDAMSFTIYLREGLKWSDGVPFTADDIVFWYEDILLNDELNPTKPQQWAPGGEVMTLEKIDDYTIVLRFSVPHPLFLYMLTDQGKGGAQQGGIIAPAHYLKKFHPKYADAAELQEMVDEKSLDSWLRLFSTKTGIQGTGQDIDLPRLSAWVPINTSTAGVTYERNPYYWKVDTEGNQLPYIDYRKYEVISEAEIIKMKLMDGDLNFGYIGGVSEDLTLYMENRVGGNYEVYEWQGTGNGRPSFCFNQNVQDDVLRPIFQDKRFRQAMSLTINREEINELQYLGMAEARQATLLSSSRFYEEEFARAYADYDPDEANRLLDEVGLKWDSNNEWRLRPDGQTFTVVVDTIQGHPVKPNELVKEYWEKVGIKTILKEYPVGTAWNRIIAGEPEAFETYAQDTDLSFMLDGGIYCAMFLTNWMTEWRQWYNTKGEEGEVPPEEIQQMFDALDTMTSTVDELARTRAGKEILRLHAENVWIIGTAGADPAFGVASKDLGNVPDESIMAGNLAWAKFQIPEQMYFKNQ